MVAATTFRLPAFVCLLLQDRVHAIVRGTRTDDHNINLAVTIVLLSLAMRIWLAIASFVVGTTAEQRIASVRPLLLARWPSMMKSSMIQSSRMKRFSSMNVTMLMADSGRRKLMGAAGKTFWQAPQHYRATQRGVVGCLCIC